MVFWIGFTLDWDCSHDLSIPVVERLSKFACSWKQSGLLSFALKMVAIITFYTGPSVKKLTVLNNIPNNNMWIIFISMDGWRSLFHDNTQSFMLGCALVTFVKTIIGWAGIGCPFWLSEKSSSVKVADDLMNTLWSIVMDMGVCYTVWVKKKRKPEFDSKYLKVDKRGNNTDFSGW